VLPEIVMGAMAKISDAYSELTTPSESRFIWKMIDLQHHYNNCTTPPHMGVGPSVWGPPPYEKVLCSCCGGVV